jgi:hypothetical protein
MLWKYEPTNRTISSAMKSQKRGERPGGTGRSMVWGMSKRVWAPFGARGNVVLQLRGSRSYRHRLGGAGQAADNSNHRIILLGSLTRVHGARVTFSSVLEYWHTCEHGFSWQFNSILIPPTVSHTPRSGIISSASLNRLVKLAMQITMVSSTICPSS